jgi:hypothetical protein
MSEHLQIHFCPYVTEAMGQRSITRDGIEGFRVLSSCHTFTQCYLMAFKLFTTNYIHVHFKHFHCILYSLSAQPMLNIAFQTALLDIIHVSFTL